MPGLLPLSLIQIRASMGPLQVFKSSVYMDMDKYGLPFFVNANMDMKDRNGLLYFVQLSMDMDRNWLNYFI